MKILRRISIVAFAAISTFATVALFLDKFDLCKSSNIVEQVNYSLLGVLIIGFVGTHLATLNLRTKDKRRIGDG